MEGCHLHESSCWPKHYFHIICVQRLAACFVDADNFEKIYIYIFAQNCDLHLTIHAFLLKSASLHLILGLLFS